MTNEIVTFDSLGLDDRLLRAIHKLGWTKPTLIQEKGIPLALVGKDILSRARTGSGKTATYAIPILNKILTTPTDQKKGLSALILVPTKELCDQTHKHVKALAQYCSKLVSIVAVSSTVDVESQKPALLQTPDIMIATPSRALAHVKAGHISLKDVSVLVVDEADLLFSFGYEQDVRALLNHMGPIFQSFLMSATMTNDVEALKDLVLQNPAVLKLEESHLPEDTFLAQHIVKCEEADKYLIFYALLAFKLVGGKVLVFVNSIDECYRLKLFLDYFSINACVLNSELPHNSRNHIVSEFNKGIYDIIIAADENRTLHDDTDDEDEDLPLKPAARDVLEVEIGGEAEAEAADPVPADEEGAAKAPAAGQDRKAGGSNSSKKGKKDGKSKDGEYGMTRGVDFVDVEWVINFDFPSHANAYIHRVGRTARAGKHGNALSFVTLPEHRETLGRIEKKLRLHNNDEASKGEVLKPYEFASSKIDGLRYRVEDAKKKLTRNSIKNARLKEIRQEILNSQKLKAHFEDNPRDLQVLRHNQQLDAKSVNKAVSTIPSYLMPSKAELSVEKEALTNRHAPAKFSHAENLSQKRKAYSQSHGHNDKRKKANADPLKSFALSRSKGSKK